MRKAIDFIKKPLLIISAIVFAVFAVVLIAVSSQKHGKKYEYSDSFFGYGIDITMTFKSENTLELEMIIAGEKIVDQTNQYKIKDGELYTFTEDGVWGKDGDIDAYEFELEFPVDPELGSMSGMEFELVCKQNQKIKVLSVAMIAVFGVLAAGSAAVLVLDKKGMLKFLFKNQEVPAAPAEGQSEVSAPVVESTPVAETPVEAAPVVETAPAEQAKAEDETKE